MNPILKRDFYIPFSQIKAQHIELGIREALSIANNELADLIKNQTLNFESTLQALDTLIEKLNHPIRLATHLMSVKDSPELRQGFEAVQPEFSAFFARLPLNEQLWQLIKSYNATEEAKNLTAIRKRHLDKTMREFIHAGADLPNDKKKEAEEIKVELSQLQTKFANNVLDATNAFEFIASEDDLVGLPDSIIQQSRENAESKGIQGYRFTLQAPSFLPFVKYSDRRDLREYFYHAYSNRACEGKFDNRSLIERILTLRRKLADLHDYNDFADYRLEMNMVKNGKVASNFLKDLTTRTKPYFKKEIDLLSDFAKNELGIADLQPWDTLYAMEKLRKAKFDIDDEVMRPYFPLDNVLEGLLDLAHKIFGIRITEQENTELWHDSISYYDVHDEDNTYLGSFYADWFPRESKRAGAWMNYFYTGGPQPDGSFKPHLGLICANFTPPQEGKPALLTHEEVETTFHEFGHLLHHILSRVEIPARAGTNVSWDFVELPSQIMENWCWERKALDIFAKHYKTGETIPKELFDKMRSARAFMGAYQQMRQLSFGTVDLELHINYPDKNYDAISYSQKVMEPFQIKPEFAHNHFVTAFSHIFTGSYAAGYYSYKWAEVLDADAFTRFKCEGILNRETGRAFVQAILSRGDSKEPEELFHEFMGRDPDISALLERTFEQTSS